MMFDDIHRDPRLPQPLNSPSGLRMRIESSNDHAGDFRGHQHFGAGSGASGVIARFEGDIRRRPGGAIARSFQGDDFRMVLAAGSVIPPPGNRIILANDDAPDHGVGLDPASTPQGQTRSVEEMLEINVFLAGHGAKGITSGSICASLRS